MLDHGGNPVRFRVGPPRLGFTAEAIFEPEAARQVLATDAARSDKEVPALEEFRRSTSKRCGTPPRSSTRPFACTRRATRSSALPGRACRSAITRSLPGQIVAVSVWALHHNPAIWPDPYRFDPDRFAAPADHEGAPDGGARYAHLPFGGGPRSCIGQYLAMAEMVVAVATIVRAFSLESLVEEPALDVGVSLLPGGTMPCRLSRAGQAGSAR